MAKILIISALKSETKQLIKLLKNFAENKQTNVYNYKSNELILVNSGVGKLNAAFSCAQAIAKYSPDLVLNIGAAGALTSKLPIGALITTNFSRQADTLSILNSNKLYIDFDKNAEIQTTIKLTDSIYNILKEKYNIKKVNTLTADFVLLDADLRDELYNSFSQKFDSFDMETFALALCCQKFNTPFATLRIITDVCAAQNLDLLKHKLSKFYTLKQFAALIYNSMFATDYNKHIQTLAAAVFDVLDTINIDIDSFK